MKRQRLVLSRHYGWVEPIDAAFWDHWQVEKSVHRGTDSFITVPPGAHSVSWVCDDGQSANATTGATSTPNIVAVEHPSIDYSTVNRQALTIGLYTYYYNFNCPYQDGSIAFINEIGMWEFFDVLGRQD